MDTFRGRLWFVTKKVLIGISYFTISLLTLITMIYLMDTFNWVFNTLTFFVMGVIILMVAFAAVSIAIIIYQKIRWLFTGK